MKFKCKSNNIGKPSKDGWMEISASNITDAAIQFGKRFDLFVSKVSRVDVCPSSAFYANGMPMLLHTVTLTT